MCKNFVPIIQWSKFVRIKPDATLWFEAAECEAENQCVIRVNLFMSGNKEVHHLDPLLGHSRYLVKYISEISAGLRLNIYDKELFLFFLCKRGRSITVPVVRDHVIFV